MNFFGDVHSIALSLESMAAAATSAAAAATSAAASAASVATSIASIAKNVAELTSVALGIPVGLTIDFSPPTVRPPEDRKMATVKLVKKSAMKPMAAKGTKAVPATFNLVDNGDDTFTIGGLDAAGNPVALPVPPWSMTVVSDTPATITVDPPTGMGSAIHAVGPIGTATLTVVATTSDGSDGPFTFTQPLTTSLGPAGALTIAFGVPTVH